jgi:hypothetical protein
LEYEPENVNAMRRYNSFAHSRQDFFTSIATVGDGIVLSLKIK